ncbi:MAG: TonB-dependent receptor [Mariniphaga sp.]|nr:TonB-dependent receptor [Mariniphaga sp.]
MKNSLLSPVETRIVKVLMVVSLAILCFSHPGYSQLPSTAKGISGETVNAAKNGKIKGKVIDADTKSVMEYASIAVYRKRDAKLVAGTITSAPGIFVISDLPNDTYYVEASFIGFNKTKVSEVKILPNAQVVDLGTLTLVPSNQQIGAVEVVAERNRVEYKIDKKVINVSNDINATGGTAVTALENTPSVEVDIDGNVSVRGSSNFTVLIDGRPSVLSGNDALKQISSASIQNIEIITNPSVKYDPDGMAGIINIVMKKNSLTGLNGSVNLNLGSGNKYGSDLLLNYKTKKINFFLGANLNDNTDHGTMITSMETYSGDTTNYLTNNGNRNQSRGGKQLKGGLDFYLTDKTSVTVSSEFGKYNFGSSENSYLHNYDVPGTLNVYSVQNNNSTREGNTINSTASFLTKFDKSGTHKLEGSFDYQSRDGSEGETIDESLSDLNYLQTNTYLSRIVTSGGSTSNEYRLKLDYTLPLNDKSKFEAGLQSMSEIEKENFNFQNFDPASGTFISNPLFTSDMNFREDIHSIYSIYSGNLSGIQYQVGLRGEYTKRTMDHSKATVPYVLDRFDYFPSLHFSYDLTEQTQVMTSYSRRINRPNGRDLDPFPQYMNQYTIRMGNPGLKPEYTDSYELSTMHKFGNSFVSAETFYRSTNDLMTRMQELKGDGIVYMTTSNMNRDFSLGGEIMGNFNINKWLLVNASFSIYNYKLKGELLGKSIDKQSTNYTSRLNSTVKLSDNSRFQLTGSYRGPTVSAQGEMKGMYFANLSYKQDFLKKKLTATVSMRDVLGTMKMEGSSTGPGFSSKMKMQRESRVVMLTLSYRINNYKAEKQGPSEQSGGSGIEEGF